MAIRVVTSADLAAIKEWWDTHRASLPEYVLERAFTTADLDDYQVRLIDPDTRTIMLGGVDGDDAVVGLLFSLSTGAAGVTAADRMLKAACQRAINNGLTVIRGEYPFPPGFDVETAKPVKYFNTLSPPLVKSVLIWPFDTSRTLVRYEGDPIALLAALTARTP